MGKVNAVPYIIWVVRSYIDARLLDIQRLKHQLFVRKDMPERGKLPLRYINNTQFRLPAGDQPADLLHGTFVVLHDISFLPMCVKIRQQMRNHIAGIGCKGKFLPPSVICHGTDDSSVPEHDTGVFPHCTAVRCDTQPSRAAFEQRTAQFPFQ